MNGITFTGSHEIGMKIFRDFAKGRWVRPTILEMGGKNATIVSRHADLERAAIGILRSAFGLQGQKCSACSRVFVEKPLYQPLLDRLVDLTNKLVIGDPTDRNVYLGPVINERAYENLDLLRRTVSIGESPDGWKGSNRTGLWPKGISACRRWRLMFLCLTVSGSMKCFSLITMVAKDRQPG